MLLSLADRERMSIYKALDIAHLAEQDDLVVDPNQQLKLDTLYAVQALNRRSDVLYAAPNFIRRPQFVPNDPLYSQQWHYPLINLPQAWDVNTGSGAIVAGTGYWRNAQPPGFAGAIRRGLRFRQ
jgi:serine protease